MSLNWNFIFKTSIKLYIYFSKFCPFDHYLLRRPYRVSSSVVCLLPHFSMWFIRSLNLYSSAIVTGTSCNTPYTFSIWLTLLSTSLKATIYRNINLHRKIFLSTSLADTFRNKSPVLYYQTFNSNLLWTNFLGPFTCLVCPC